MSKSYRTSVCVWISPFERLSRRRRSDTTGNSQEKKLEFDESSDLKVIDVRNGAPSSTDAHEIEERVRCLNEDQVLDRYHELVDKQLINELNYKEYFELERIEARLDFNDSADLEHIKAIETTWDRAKADVTRSLQQLLSRISAS